MTMAHNREKNIVTTTLKIVDTTTERLTPQTSQAPNFCPVITANPFVIPAIANIIRKNSGATAPTDANACTPSVLPTITISARL